ncbi:putative serine/threonine-protein kinase-like protein CCR4-like [Capsicum annuum]|nr:putative serine/threonine-protein kinase-like protein CCR4-like [Capsicum annuum]KAF3643056.1 putative serine/threonine-protein kinase-like protein CCR4-like [Capsicum annuum]
MQWVMLGTTKEALQSQTHKSREESLKAGNIAPLAITWVIGIKRNMRAFEGYDLMHIAAEDLPRAEIAAGSKNRMQAKKSMDKGKLAPDEIVVTMVKEQLNGPDSQEKGWLLDGYPRSSSQAITLKEFGLQPDLHIHLESALTPVKLHLQTHHQNVKAVFSMYKDITVKDFVARTLSNSNIVMISSHRD